MPWVVGNWKMNPMQANAKQLINEFKELLNKNEISPAQCHLAVAPISIALSWVQDELKQASRPVHVVAQDVSRMSGTGAYTGEVSASLLKDSAIEHVLIGHSERREFFGDNPQVIIE